MFISERIGIIKRLFQSVLLSINQHYARENIKQQCPQMAIFAFDHIGLHINIRGLYDKEALEAVFKFLETRRMLHAGVAVDVGANIGNHAIYFSNKFERVFAFEPNPRTHKLLNFNTSYNSKNIKTYDFGLSDTSESVQLLVENLTNIGGTFIVPKEKYCKKQKIKARVEVLDNLKEFDDLNIALMKVDVEGHEAHVFRGAKEKILKNKPVILFEQLADEFENGSSESVELLRSFGYQFYVYQRNFYLGEGKPQKLISLILRLFFGENIHFKKMDTFKRRHYNMIVGLPAT